MNRYPAWKYVLIVVVLLIAALYTLPNFFGEAPAVQISSSKSTVKVDTTTLAKVEQALKGAGITADGITLEAGSIKARFGNTDTQGKAKDAIQTALSPDPSDSSYVVALNLLSRSPAWLTSLNANPMYLGLDLRGGVHFMLQVDMQAALTKKAESYAGDLRTTLREKNIRHGGISRDGQAVDIRVRDEATLTAARNLIADQFPDLLTSSSPEGDGFKLRAFHAHGCKAGGQAQSGIHLANRIGNVAAAAQVHCMGHAVQAIFALHAFGASIEAHNGR